MATASEEDPLCKKCLKPIPNWAPAGNCPACLFGSGKNKEAISSSNDGNLREKVGNWELHEQIGEGAFGVVFAAEQTRPVRRSAALKILRPGMGSKELMARFQAESQALALMNHPDIVTVYDAGTTEDGRPFFAMELVPGEEVTRFASNFSLDDKLVLFDRICAVVEHAHSRGIIHRDLKPGNILAYQESGEEPVIKLLDFGIAKATDQVLTEATILTGSGNFLGTPEYMSPEQTVDSDIDLRADVYSLGIILFELLAGRPPFVLKSHSLDAVMRFLNQIRDDDPPTLSSLVTTTVTDDLEWITSKAIEKDRARRYRTVSELRDDLKRFRSNKPVQARPPDTFYIASKFIRRNWKLTATVAAIFLSVVGAAIISGLMAIKAQNAARETSRAFSMSDMRSAVSELERRDLPKAIAHLTQSLRTDPANNNAVILLTSTLEQYPISKLEWEYDLRDNRLRVAHFTDNEGNSAIVSEPGKLQFLDAKGRQRAPSIDAPGTNQYSALSPDKSLLFVTNIQGEFLLIDLNSNQLLPLDQVEYDERQRYSEIAFSSDGDFLCAGSSGGSICVWDTETGKIQWNDFIESGVQSLVFSGQNKRIALASRDGKVMELDSASGETLSEHPGNPEPIRKLVNSGSGYRYYTVSSSGIVAAVDAGKIPKTFTEERINMPLLHTTVDPKRRLVAYAGETEVSVWTVDGRTIISRLPLLSPPTCITIHPRENLAFIATTNSGIQIWDFENNRILGTEIRIAKNVAAMHVDAQSNLLHTITRDGDLRIFRFPLPAEDTINSGSLPGNWNQVPIEYRNEHFIRAGISNFHSLEKLPPEIPRTFGLSADQKKIFATYRDGFIRLWNCKTGKLEAQVKTGTTSARCSDLSPDGKIIAYRDRFSAFAFYHLKTKSYTTFPSRHQRDISSIVFSPDSEKCAIATDGGNVNVYHVKTNEPVFPQVQHDVRGLVTPHYCQFSPDGRVLVSWGESDKQFRFWDTTSGDPAENPIPTKGIPRFGCFIKGSEKFAAITEEDDQLYLQHWSVSQALPVTPRRKIRKNELSAIDFQIPDKATFTEEQLLRIDQLNGLTVGDSDL